MRLTVLPETETETETERFSAFIEIVDYSGQIETEIMTLGVSD